MFVARNIFYFWIITYIPSHSLKPFAKLNLAINNKSLSRTLFLIFFLIAVVQPGEPAWHDIRKSFGAEVFQADGTLNRQALGQIVFGDIAKRQQLNEITHPRIYRRIFWRLLQMFFSGNCLFLSFSPEITPPPVAQTILRSRVLS